MPLLTALVQLRFCSLFDYKKDTCKILTLHSARFSRSDQRTNQSEGVGSQREQAKLEACNLSFHVEMLMQTMSTTLHSVGL